MPRHGSGGPPGHWWDYPVMQEFKWTPSATTAHSGIDLSMPVGTPIVAPMDGTVLDAGAHPWGHQVDEQVVIAGSPYVLTWIHLSKTAVQPGPVKKGQLLGYSGAAPKGYYSGPPGAALHTHFELTHGTTPPYTGYNPHTPTKDSYPVNPAFVLLAFQTGTPPANFPGGGSSSEQIAAGCVHSIQFPGVAGVGATAICLDAGLDVLIRGTLVFGGIVLVVMAFILLALGNPEVQTAGKQAGGKVAEAIGLGL